MKQKLQKSQKYHAEYIVIDKSRYSLLKPWSCKEEQRKLLTILFIFPLVSRIMRIQKQTQEECNNKYIEIRFQKPKAEGPGLNRAGRWSLTMTGTPLSTGEIIRPFLLGISLHIQCSLCCILPPL